MNLINIIMKRKIFALILIVLYSNTVVLAADSSDNNIMSEENTVESTDIVYTEEELIKWCEEKQDSDAGGRVTLGDNITVTKGVSFYRTGAIVIDTGPYGLVFDRGYIWINELEIIGEGVEVPVLDVHSVIAYGYFWESGWNDFTQQQKITATGRNGVGGIALRIRQDDGYAKRITYYATEGLIRSYGTGAIGLYLDVPLDAYCFKIEVEGSGSTAVYAPQGANLFYCKLSASQTGAAVVSGSDQIVLDTCNASPAPQNAQMISRSIAAVVSDRFYYPVKQYDSIGFIEPSSTFLLGAGDGYSAIKQVLEIVWEVETVDTSILGETVIYGSFLPPFQGLGLEEGFPLELTIDIRDPHVPCISDIRFREDEGLGAHVYLFFWDIYERGDENVILRRSDDGGESWYDFSDSPQIEWEGNNICFYYGEITAPVMLQLEVSGVRSNIVSLYTIDGVVCSGVGGDRDGGDQHGQEPLPESDSKPVGESGQISGSIGGEKTPDSTGENESPDDKNDANDISTIEDKYSETESETINAANRNVSSVVLTGKQIAQQTKVNPDYLTFIKNGLKVVIPTAAISNLALNDGDIFTVFMKSDEETVLIQFFVNETEITEFSGYDFTVYVPYVMEENASAANIYCYKDPEIEIFAEGYEDSLLIFTLDKAGYYIIKDTTHYRISAIPDLIIGDRVLEDVTVGDGDSRQENWRWLVPVLLFATAALVTATVFVVRQKHKRRRTPDA